MNQIIQSFKTEATLLEEVPTPKVKRGQVLTETSRKFLWA